MKWYYEKSNGGKVYHKNGDTIKRCDVEPFLNSLQQLNADIASLHSQACAIPLSSRGAQFQTIVDKLRQLSTVSTTRRNE